MADAAAVGSVVLRDIPVEALSPNPFQPRKPVDPETLAELAASIRRQGVLQPILVRERSEHPGSFQIVAGERRWQASMIAERPSIPCYVRRFTDREASEVALIENLQRSDLDALEEAAGFRRLMDEFGVTQQELATSVGKSRPYVANTVRLLGLPDSVQSQLRAGKLTAGHARALLGHDDPAQVAALVIRDGLNVRQTEALVERAHGTPAPARPVEPTHKADVDIDTQAIETDLSERLGLRVVLKRQGVGGRITLHYTHLDQLDHILAKLGG